MLRKGCDTSFALWLFLGVSTLLVAVFLLVVALLPFSTLKTYGDAIARDGNLQSLTPQVYAHFHLPVLVSGAVLLLAGIFILLRREFVRAKLKSLGRFLHQTLLKTKIDAQALLCDIRGALPAKREFILLALIVILAAFLRLTLINRGMEYDESYTFSEFARHSFRQVVTDYHVPNNHVFHTILVRCSYLLFGNHPWALRVPAFIAGMALVIAVYFLARRIYSELTGLVAAGGVAVLPVLVLYSVNARGYTLICFWSVLLLLIGDYVRRNRNLAAWILMTLVTALGFYTIPIMLYPLGIAVTWLFLSGIFGDISPEYGGMKYWLAYLAGFGISAALFTLLLYSPIFHANGILTVFNGNTVVESLPMSEFLRQFSFKRSLNEWTIGRLPRWIITLLVISSLFALLIHRRISSQRVPTQAAALLFLIPLVIIQRPVYLPRVWLFLLAITILWGSAGLLGLPRFLQLPHKDMDIIQGGATLLLLLAFIWFGLRFITPYLQNPELSAHPNGLDAELVTIYLKDVLKEGDIVVISNDDDAPYWYYFDAYHIPEIHIRRVKEHPFQHAYIISHTKPKYEIEWVIEHFGPDLVFFQMETLKPVKQIRNTIIYEIWPYQNAVDRAFGIK